MTFKKKLLYFSSRLASATTIAQLLKPISEKIPVNTILSSRVGAASQDQLKKCGLHLAHWILLLSLLLHSSYFLPSPGSPSTGIRWVPGNLPHTLTKLAFIMACQSSIAATVFLIPAPAWKALGPAGRHGESTHSVLRSATLHISHSPRLCFVSFLLLPALVRCTCLKQLSSPQRLMFCSPSFCPLSTSTALFPLLGFSTQFYTLQWQISMQWLDPLLMVRAGTKDNFNTVKNSEKHQKFMSYSRHSPWLPALVQACMKRKLWRPCQLCLLAQLANPVWC